MNQDPCATCEQQARLRAQVALGLDLSAGPPTIPAHQLEGYLALYDYYLLWCKAQELTAAVDIATGTQKQALSQQFTHTLALLQTAEASVASLGYGPNAADIGVLGLDYIEPPASWAPPAPWPFSG